MCYTVGEKRQKGEDFLLDEKLTARVLEEALSRGADFSEVFYEDTESNVVTLTDLAVEDAVFSRKCGVGIRVARGVLTAYATTADLSEQALLSAARAAAAALDEAAAGKIAPAKTARHYGPQDSHAFFDVDNDARVRLVREMARAAKAQSEKIVQTTGSYSDTLQRVFVANSDGLRAFDVRPRTRVRISAVAGDGTSTQTGGESPGYGKGFDAWREFDAEGYGKAAAIQALVMLDAPECPAGTAPVVIGNGFGGVIFHEACGHALEATAVARGASVFAGKLGEKIASDCVTAVDDGTLEGQWGSVGMDDEGHPSMRNVLIENGVLKGYLIDGINARRMHAAPTGSSRRQGYEIAPTSRMTNTFIAPGTDSIPEMIATMGEGLYAKKMGGGSVNPMTGEFNFAVLEGYWVRDGKILRPVRGATLIGRGAEVLKKIDRVADDFMLGQGMCGSISGSIPVNVGQPTIRVESMIIGGKGGAM